MHKTLIMITLVEYLYLLMAGMAWWSVYAKRNGRERRLYPERYLDYSHSPLQQIPREYEGALLLLLSSAL